MDKNYAIKLIQDVFQNSFNREQFVAFAKNLFNFLDTERNFIYRGNLIPDAYEPYIHTLERIGKYKDAQDNKIDVLIVHLKKEHSIEHARSMQRNFIAWYLGGSRGGELKDAALVAFYTDNPDDWRFSLVKMDYQIVESETGKIKTKTELTPARRFSFLVGKNENSHTAQRQLLPTLQDEINNPLLSDLEKAFNIEVVTQEFFEKYCGLFLDVKEALEKIITKNCAIAQDFIDKGVDPVDFSKKLLGQIVFLYFLQKKGWFGVGRDNDWGTGPKNFLRLLFEKMIADYKNFFNDVLEPLFYEALAKERDDDFYSRFNCKVPFLNGGLFDPICNYDWVHTDICLPDELFSNKVKTKEGDTGTGILDIFDRYNFTVKEDEPLEKEVAVDPEMLGKVFENLLEVKDRKSKGTYYTPREIVHYMCQESLINYLVNETDGKVNRKDIETLIQYGESVIEHDSKVEQEGKETHAYSYKLSESIRKNAQLFDEKLKNIRVCDPAIGSGAFPVGMMNEIVRTRNTLTNYLEDKDGRSIYSFKRNAIQNSLYGVDIDPGAVEIAKLRLWLSLVVDEENIIQIKPLPNLDYKIMQGNSLLEEFEGVRLFDDRLLNSYIPVNDDQIKKLEAREKEIQKNLMAYYQRNPSWMKNQKLERPTELYQLEGELKRVQLTIKDEKEFRFQIKDSNQNALFGDEQKARKIWEELQSLQKEFFETTQKKEKDELKKQVEKLEWELIEATLKEQNKESSLKKLEQYKKSNIKPFFLWKLNFSEVFQEKGGFDIVIGNPPYGADLTSGEKEIFKQIYSDVHVRTPDTFNYFISKSIQILKKGDGTLSFIVSNNLLFQNEYIKTRELFIKNNQIKIVLNLGDSVFENATVPSCLFIISTGMPKTDYYFQYADLRLDRGQINNGSFDIHLKQYELADLSETPSFVFGVDRTSINILNKVAHKSHLIDNIVDEVASGISTGGDKIFRLPLHTIESLHLESELLHKVIVGREMDKYTTTDTNHFVIYTTRETKIDNYPKIMKYLSQFKEQLLKRSESKAGILPWFALNRQRYPGLFTGEKVLFRQTSDNVRASIDKDEFYCLDSTLILKLKSGCGYDYKFILGILNSTLNNFIYNQLTQESGRVFAQVKPQNIRKLYIPELKLAEQKPFIEIVDKILDITKDEDYLQNSTKQAHVKEYEKQINQMVYELYGLTDEEIKIVEARQDEK